MYKLGIKVGKNLSKMIFHRIVHERPNEQTNTLPHPSLTHHYLVDLDVTTRDSCSNSYIIRTIRFGRTLPSYHSQLLSRFLRFELKTSILCETYIRTVRFCRVFLLPFIDFYCILQDSNPKHLHYERLKLNSDAI